MESNIIPETFLHLSMQKCFRNQSVCYRDIGCFITVRHNRSPFTVSGNHSAISGNTISIPMTIAIHAMNGKTPI